jgi:predicted transcriptional regulator
MALSNDILKTYFNKPPKKPSPPSAHLLENAVPHFKVFDDPTKNTNINTGQTQDKPKTNLRQMEDKNKTEFKTNLRQPEKTKSPEIKHLKKPKTEPKTSPKTKPGQTEDEAKTDQVFFSLVGLQKKIVLFVYGLCKKTLNKITPPISIEYIATTCETTKSSAQKTIQRLEDKGALIRANYKNGRGGWTQYELPAVIYNDILHSDLTVELSTNLGQSYDKYKTEPRTEPRTQVPSSSSSLKDLKETTTTEETDQPKHVLPEEWITIDTNPLNHIGFGRPQLLQLLQLGMLAPDMVQDSIFAFAFDLEINNKAKSIKTNPLNYLMGTLKKGIVYTCSNYEPPHIRAMREYREQKAAALIQQEEMEKEIFDMEFTAWKQTLSEERILEILPNDIKQSEPFKKYGVGEAGRAASILREHFKITEWSEKKSQIFTSMKASLRVSEEA